MSRAAFIRSLPSELTLAEVMERCVAHGFDAPTRQAVYAARRYVDHPDSRPICPSCGRKLPA